MDALQSGQVTKSAADIYQDFFVPALFGQWAGPICDAAKIGPGDSVLDVACGTGVVAREAFARVGSSGSVTGLDINPGMLAVARSSSSSIAWQEADVAALPFADSLFDAVTCQFGLMFFEDRTAALAEMQRVLKPGGRLAIAVWDSLDRTPGYDEVVRLIEHLLGADIAAGMRAPFVLGDTEGLVDIFRAAGIGTVDVSTHDGQAKFDSIESWVHTDIKGWTLADLIDDDQYDVLLTEARQVLRQFCSADGAVSFAAPAHIATAIKG